MKARIGIFGGTFNPIHLGHLTAAQDACEVFDLSKVLFVPCALPPHKNTAQLAPSAHRVAMLEKAIADNPDFEICDLEVRRGGTNYSIDTVRHLRKSRPLDDLFFIIGSDSLIELHLWKEIDELAQLCQFVTLVRPGFDPQQANAQNLRLDATLSRNILSNVAAVHQVGISASDIRHRVAEGMSIRYLVPQAVEVYIAENNLYRI